MPAAAILLVIAKQSGMQNFLNYAPVSVANLMALGR
jgi:hypothetical protein